MTLARNASRAMAFSLLLLGSTAYGANHLVGVGDCYGVRSCFTPAALAIQSGDSVTFYVYQEDVGDILPHNVVADDGSFRCARGCDNEGGDGTPRAYQSQWLFTRTFNVPGIVHYHDEVTGVGGVIIVRDGPAFAVGPGVTGLWYDPALDGHGMFVEVLPDNRVLVAWLSFDPGATGQAWFIGVGAYNGGTATIDALHQPTGGRWPYAYVGPPRPIVKNRWGSLNLNFLDCDNVTVGFDSERGYDRGTVYLKRLTRPAGVACP